MSKIFEGVFVSLTVDGKDIAVQPLTFPKRMHYSEIERWIQRNLEFPYKSQIVRFDAAPYGIAAAFAVPNLTNNLAGIPEGSMITINSRGPLYADSEGFVTETEVIRAVFKLVAGFAMHEFMEAFKVNSEAVFDPHQNNWIEQHIIRAIEDVVNRHSIERNIQSFPKERP